MKETDYEKVFNKLHCLFMATSKFCKVVIVVHIYFYSLP